MHRGIRIVNAFSILALAGALEAQSEVGSWKLNPDKSTYSGVQAPKRVTVTFQTTDGGVTNHTQGQAGDGSPINFGYSAKYDGTDAAIAGSGAWNGAESVSLKRIDANTLEARYKKKGQTVVTSRIAISSDAKVMTVTAQGTGPDGKATEVHAVYEKH